MTLLRYFDVLILYHLEVTHLFLGEFAPASAGQVFLGKSGEYHAVEAYHIVAQGFEDAAHYSVASRVELYAYQAAFAAGLAMGLAAGFAVADFVAGFAEGVVAVFFVDMMQTPVRSENGGVG